MRIMYKGSAQLRVGRGNRIIGENYGTSASSSSHAESTWRSKEFQRTTFFEGAV